MSSAPVLPVPEAAPEPHLPETPALATPGKPRLVIITGISGSGKSQALRIFEDLGFYCVDNVHPALLPQLAALGNGRSSDIACVVDVRSGTGLGDLSPVLTELAALNLDVTVLFLEASDPVLINRYKETRRKHPLLLEAGGILASLERERVLLADLKSRAHKVIDTSEHTPRSLSDLIGRLFIDQPSQQAGLVITVLSFGFKHGLPLDADLVFDVRFLANPHYVRELRWQDGLQKDVEAFIRADPVTQPYLERLFALIDFSLPHYVREGKAYLTLAIGCTGGRHRSVMVAEALAGSLRDQGYDPLVQHRDIKK